MAAQILLNGVSGFFVQLLTVGRLTSAIIFRSKKTGPDLSNGALFPTDYVRSAAKLLLILVLAISYSVMAPIVLLPALMSFGTIYIVHKYLLIFVWESEFESGGRMWPVFVTSVLFGLSVRLGPFCAKHNIIMHGILTKYISAVGCSLGSGGSLGADRTLWFKRRLHSSSDPAATAALGLLVLNTISWAVRACRSFSSTP
eukprot:SAG11_NODE_1668_length_4494_cov_1.724460_2_plen_200_part_00